jgi:replication factor C subunit 3/5
VDRVRIQRQVFETPSKKKVEISTYSSNYHIEVNPSDVGMYDRVVVQELIKHVAETHPLDSHPFKVIVLQEVDRLTKDAQDALRRTMEKYISSCRLILCALSTSRVTPAIQSRCLAIRVAAPSPNQIVKVLQNVAKKESITLPLDLADRIAEKSDGNLRRAVLMLEACRAERYPFVEKQPIVEPDWERYLKETAFQIVQEQSPTKLLEVRERLYELLCHCIPVDLIYKGLLKELVRNCDNQLKAEVCAEAARSQWMSVKGSKQIIHLESFIATFMSMYKRFVEMAITDDFDD